MNKIFGFAAVLLCGLFFAGCSEEDSKVLDDLTGPSDTWCTMPVTYASETGSASTTLNISFYYASEEVKPNNSLTGLRSDIESIPEGSYFCSCNTWFWRNQFSSYNSYQNSVSF